MIKILDCTTRDGGHNTNWNFSDDFIKNLLDCLNKSNVSFYEIGYRNYLDKENKGKFYNCTPELLQQFYKIKGNIKLGVMTDTKRFSINDFKDKKDDYIDFVRVACHPDKIEETLCIAQDLHRKGYLIFVQLMDISNIEDSGYTVLKKWKNKHILESLYFADSYGTLAPEQIEQYFTKLKSIGYNKISFHGHNNIQMALPNSLKAIELGAYSIDVTLNGLGRCGGNLNAAELFEKLNNFTPEYYNTIKDCIIEN